MKRLETRERLIYYCDVCGEECGCSWTTFAGGTEREAHACDRLDNEGDPSCAQELTARMRCMPGWDEGLPEQLLADRETTEPKT